MQHPGTSPAKLLICFCGETEYVWPPISALMDEIERGVWRDKSERDERRRGNVKRERESIPLFV